MQVIASFFHDRKGIDTYGELLQKAKIHPVKLMEGITAETGALKIMER